MRNSDRAEMNDVIGFLNAWLDEDEHLARRTNSGEWTFDTAGQLLVNQGQTISKIANLGVDVFGWHIARHDPARVLAEVAVIRQVIADYQAADGALVGGNYDDTDPGWRGIRAGRDALKSVLVAYAEAAGWKRQ